MFRIIYGPMIKIPLSLVLAAGCSAMVAHAQVYTPFDISANYNYDAVGTPDEIAVQAPDGVNAYTLADRLGNHSIGNKLAFAPETTPGAGNALPYDGSLLGGKYTISTAFDNGTDFLTKSNNTVLVQGDNTNPTQAITFTLPVGQQAQYDAINMAFVVQRSSNASGYSSQITVTYTDASSEVIMLTNAIGDGSTQRGTFGSNNFSLADDTYSFTNEAPLRSETVTLSNVAYFPNRYLGLSGSGASQRSEIRSTDDTAIWEFADDIDIDSSKTLESITVQLTRGGVNRNNSLYVFGVTGVVIPEPQTYALVAGLGCLALAAIRRRRR